MKYSGILTIKFKTCFKKHSIQLYASTWQALENKALKECKKLDSNNMNSNSTLSINKHSKIDNVYSLEGEHITTISLNN